MRRHPALARFAAPAAFLLAATVLVLLVRAGLDGDASPDARTGLPAATAPRETTEPEDTGPRETQEEQGSTEGQELYEIRSGDTLASVAAAHDTTVERLLVLNPDIDPTGLQIGQRIRVK